MSVVKITTLTTLYVFHFWLCVSAQTQCSWNQDQSLPDWWLSLFKTPPPPKLKFLILLSTQCPISQSCYAHKFAQHEISSLIKIRITNQISICCMLLLIYIQLLFACPENHVGIWLAFLLLSREKFHAKQICVLSSSMILGPADEKHQSLNPVRIL